MEYLSWCTTYYFTDTETLDTLPLLHAVRKGTISLRGWVPSLSIHVRSHVVHRFSCLAIIIYSRFHSFISSTCRGVLRCDDHPSLFLPARLRHFLISHYSTLCHLNFISSQLDLTVHSLSILCLELLTVHIWTIFPSHQPSPPPPIVEIDLPFIYRERKLPSILQDTRSLRNSCCWIY